MPPGEPPDYESLRQRQVLHAIAERHGSDAPLFLRCCAALVACAPASLRLLDDVSPIEYEGPGGVPSPVYSKLMLIHIAAAAGLPVEVPVHAPVAELLRFLSDHTAMARRRFGTTQRRYLLLGLRHEGPPGLTLAVPPSSPGSWSPWWTRQATSRDDVFNRFSCGIRVNVAALRACPHVPADLKDALLYGHTYSWTGCPPQCRKKNYKSCVTFADEAAVEFDRIIAAGFAEGPLDYVPWTLNPIACIVKTSPYKVRNIVDMLRSQVNEHLLRTPCVLDGLPEAVACLQWSDLLWKLDMTDAFHSWLLHWADLEFHGWRHPRTGHYYRYRFMPFGNRQSPSWQQRWARTVQAIIRGEGLQYCVPGSAEGDYTHLVLSGAYLDDFQGACRRMTPWQAALAYWSVHCTLGDYNIPIKHAKNEWPAPRGEYVGFALDTETGLVSMPDARRAKFQAAVRELTAYGPGVSVPRLVLASVVGKLQWCCLVVREGQAHLVSAYHARDLLINTNAVSHTSAAWLPDILCSLTPEAHSDLLWWVRRLDHPCEARFLWPGETHGVLWGPTAPPLPSDDDLFSLPRPYEVVTSDASGWAGGAWWRHRSLHYVFTAAQLQGVFGSSSNLRELYMVPCTLLAWGPFLRNQKVLFRLDNQASVGAVNRLASMSPPVQQLLLWLVSILLEFNIRLFARYLPGKRNDRADGLSRLTGAIDDQDWQLLAAVFTSLAASWGPFAVDACSDPLGRNSHCDVYWSALNSCLTHSWAGLHVYCNPPFRAAGDVLRHFLGCHASAPATTSAVFVLPVWPAESWWRCLAGGCVVGYYPPGSPLFTLPDWRLSSRANPVPRRRVSQGPTPWPVLMVLFPPAASLRFEAAPHRALPRLWGDPRRDLVLLRGLPHGIVRPLRPAARDHGPRALPVHHLRPLQPCAGALPGGTAPAATSSGHPTPGAPAASPPTAPAQRPPPPPMPGEACRVDPPPPRC